MSENDDAQLPPVAKKRRTASQPPASASLAKRKKSTVLARLKKKRVSQLERGRRERDELKGDLDARPADYIELIAELTRVEKMIAGGQKSSELYQSLLKRCVTHGTVRDAYLHSIVQRMVDVDERTQATFAPLLDNLKEQCMVLDVLFDDLEAWRIAQENQLRCIQKLTLQVEHFTHTHLYSGPANRPIQVPDRQRTAPPTALALTGPETEATTTTALAPARMQSAQTQVVLHSASVVQNGARTALVESLDGARVSSKLPSLGDSILLTSVARSHVHPADTATARMYERNEAQQLKRKELRRSAFEEKLRAGARLGNASLALAAAQ